MKRMTQDRFYRIWDMDRSTKEGRLIVDLRSEGFTWSQIDTVLTQMTDPYTPYHEDWGIANHTA